MNKKLDLSYLTYAGELPNEYTIPKEHMPRAYDQGNGVEDKTCSGIALTLIAEVFYKKYTEKAVKLSTAYTYCKHRPKEHKGTSGTLDIEYAVNGLATGGTCKYDDMPDFIDVQEGCAYLDRHPELDEKAKPIANVFEGWINLKVSRKAETFENIKRALISTELPVYGAMEGHAVVFVGFKGNCVKYRDWYGNETLWLLKHTNIKEAYAFMPNKTTNRVYTDVPENHWAKQTVDRGRQLGIAKGFSDGTFRPNAMCTRAETLQMMLNLYDILNKE